MSETIGKNILMPEKSFEESERFDELFEELNEFLVNANLSTFEVTHLLNVYLNTIKSQCYE